MTLEINKGMNSMKVSQVAVAVAALTVWGAAAHAAQLLTDGGFEGNFTNNWTKSGSGNASKQSGAGGQITGAYILPRYKSGKKMGQCDENAAPIGVYTSNTGSGKVSFS